jgi:hypothetical protein
MSPTLTRVIVIALVIDAATDGAALARVIGIAFPVNSALVAVSGADVLAHDMPPFNMTSVSHVRRNQIWTIITPNNAMDNTQYRHSIVIASMMTVTSKDEPITVKMKMASIVTTPSCWRTPARCRA